MSELEDLRKLLAETKDAKKQMVIMAKIKKLEQELGLRKKPQIVTEDRLSRYDEKDENEENIGTQDKPVKIAIEPV